MSTRAVAVVCSGLLLSAVSRSSRGDSGQFTLREVTSAGEPIPGLRSALRLLEGQLNSASTQTFADSYIDFLKAGDFPDSGTQVGSGPKTRIAVEIGGEVQIPTAGTYSFALSSRQSAAMSLDGKVLHVGGAAGQTHVKQFKFNAAGNYPLSMTYLGKTTPTKLELSASPGSFHSVHARKSDFQLVGDTSAGGLALVGGTPTAAGDPTSTINNGAPLVTGAGNTIAVNSGTTTGLLTTNGQEWQGGGSYTWKINDANGSAGSADGWDEIDMSSLSVTGVSASTPFTIVAQGEDGTAGQTPAGLNTSTPDTTYNWVIAHSDSQVSINGTPAASESLTDSGLFALDTSGLSVDGQTASASDFSLNLVADGSGDDLVLSYTAAPEPSAALLTTACITPLLTARRRKAA